MDLITRKATFTDAADMAYIHIHSWEAAYKNIVPEDAITAKNAGRLAMWHKTLSCEHNNYIALYRDTPVGLMGIHPGRDNDLPDAGEIGSIYLHPDYFGKGYGQEMIEYAIVTLRQQGFKIITLWVLEENIRARRFYEKCGFSFDGTKEEIIIGKPLIKIRYKKDLTDINANVDT
jgi:RimJ/RimL family protein N-acetyltransferase